MTQKFLLVDFENVRQVDLTQLDDSFQVIILVGASQKSIPMDLVASAQKLGTRVKWQQVDANGNNALDFFIAYQLGRIMEQGSQHECIVLSKDKGFDPLLRHLSKSGLKCKRINSLMEIAPKASIQSEDANYRRVVEVLCKLDENKRPRKRATLSRHISSIFQKKLAQPEIDRIIDILLANKMISEVNNAITYEF